MNHMKTKNQNQGMVERKRCTSQSRTEVTTQTKKDGTFMLWSKNVNVVTTMTEH